MIAGVVAVWLAAAALTHVVGMWGGFGGVAVLLGAGLLVVERAALWPRLQHSRRALLYGVVVGAAHIGATSLLAPLLARLPWAAVELALLHARFASLPPWAALLTIVPIIAGEELVWRGVVQMRLARRLGEVRAVPLAALLYAVAHLPSSSWLLCVAAAGCGLVWSALAARTRGLVAPFVAHLVWDVAVLFIMPLSSM